MGWIILGLFFMVFNGSMLLLHREVGTVAGSVFAWVGVACGVLLIVIQMYKFILK